MSDDLRRAAQFAMKVIAGHDGDYDCALRLSLATKAIDALADRLDQETGAVAALAPACAALLKRAETAEEDRERLRAVLTEIYQMDERRAEQAAIRAQLGVGEWDAVLLPWAAKAYAALQKGRK